MFANIGVYIAFFGGIGCSCCFLEKCGASGKNMGTAVTMILQMCIIPT